MNSTNNQTTLLPLETFRELMMFHPWHFWGLANNDKVPLDNGCNTLVKEYGWQPNAGGTGRTEIRQAIATAEQRLLEYLNYAVAPHWVTDEVHDLPLSYFYGSAAGGDILITLREGKLRQLATYTTELVAEPTIAITDQDSDGILDTFVLNQAVPVGTKLEDLLVYFRGTDLPSALLYKPGKDFQIRPVVMALDTVTNILTVNGPAWLVVKPQLREGLTYQPGYNHSVTGRDSSGAIDPNQTASYVTALAVWRRVTTVLGKVKVFIDPGSGVVPASTEVGATIINAESGQIVLSGNCCWPWPGLLATSCASGVMRVKVSYEAGAELANWQTVVARFAAAELMRKVCGCDAANQELFNWMADSADPDSKFKPAFEEMSSPLGTKKGAIYAWKQVRNLRLLRGISI